MPPTVSTSTSPPPAGLKMYCPTTDKKPGFALLSSASKTAMLMNELREKLLKSSSALNKIARWSVADKSDQDAIAIRKQEVRDLLFHHPPIVVFDIKGRDKWDEGYSVPSEPGHFTIVISSSHQDAVERALTTGSPLSYLSLLLQSLLFTTWIREFGKVIKLAFQTPPPKGGLDKALIGDLVVAWESPFVSHIWAMPNIEGVLFNPEKSLDAPRFRDVRVRLNDHQFFNQIINMSWMEWGIISPKPFDGSILAENPIDVHRYRLAAPFSSGAKGLREGHYFENVWSMVLNPPPTPIVTIELKKGLFSIFEDDEDQEDENVNPWSDEEDSDTECPWSGPDEVESETSEEGDLVVTRVKIGSLEGEKRVDGRVEDVNIQGVSA